MISNIKAIITAVIFSAIGLLSALAVYFKGSADKAKQSLKNQTARAEMADKRIKKHESRQEIEDDIYSANESHIDERLRKYYRSENTDV